MNLENTLPLADAKELRPLNPTHHRSVRRPVGGMLGTWVRTQRGKWLGLVLPVTILSVWELVTRFGLVKPLFVPAPEAVGAAFYEMMAHEGLLGDFWTSASVVAQGFLIGATGGLLVGFAAGLSKTVEQVLGSVLDSIRQVPALAWFPLIALWVGIGTPAKIVIIAKTVFFPVFLNTLQGIRAVPREYIEVGQVFNYSKTSLLRRIILPAASPSIFVGLRYGAGLAWAFVIAAEMLGGRYGLGFLLTRSQELLLTDQLFVVIVVIGLVGFSVDVVFRVAERHVLRWKRGFEG